MNPALLQEFQLMFLEEYRFVILMFVLIGFIGFVVLAVMNIAFAIIAAIKANNGELWQYPFNLKIMK
ncbi:DUF4870 domain-containing protein [Alteromonas sp. 5E99-2]|nr:DUF4870 domain-containing protein [Alteromonas sp. 5E99-2]